MERAVRWFDRFQIERPWLAHLLGTFRKYADDRASALAAVVTYQIFLGLLPLLVVVLTVVGALARGSADIREAMLDSTLGQFPVVGERLREDVSGLTVSGPWVAVSVAGLLWTAVGIYTGLQLAMNQVWNVEGVDRQGFVSRHVRALLLFVLLVGAAIGTGVVRRSTGAGDGLPGWAQPVVALFGALVAGALLLGVLRLTTSPAVATVRLVPAALVAGLLWELIQRVGTWLVVDQVSRATDLYGSIGFVVALLGWVNLLARAVLYACEAAVVSWDRLWPRRLAQPPLTHADRRVLERLVRNERRRPEQHIEVTFPDDHPTE